MTSYNEYYWSSLDRQFSRLHALVREIAKERGVDLEAAGQRKDLTKAPVARSTPVRPSYARRYVSRREAALSIQEPADKLQEHPRNAEEVEWLG